MNVKARDEKHLTKESQSLEEVISANELLEIVFKYCDIKHESSLKESKENIYLVVDHKYFLSAMENLVAMVKNCTTTKSKISYSIEQGGDCLTIKILLHGRPFLYKEIHISG